MVQSAAPDVDDLAEYVRRIEAARYSEDLGYDLKTASALARRILESDTARVPKVAAYAMELLADQSVSLPHGNGSRADRELIMQVDLPYGALGELVEEDLAIVMLATTDGSGAPTLLRFGLASGATIGPALEPSTVFDRRALDRWRESFPYEYGVSTELNIFYTSTLGIGVSELPLRAVVVASTDLQAFPVNLFNIDETLAGWTHRLASAPSISWRIASR